MTYKYFITCFLKWIRSATPPAPADKGDQEQHDKDEEQNLSNRCRACSDTKESKGTGDDCYNKEDNCPA
jgi:hypothetical protein